MAKRRRSFPKPGEVFRVPLPSGRYAYIRGLQGNGISVLREFESEPVDKVANLSNTDVLYFVMSLPAAVRNRDWPKIGVLPLDAEEDQWVPPTYVEVSRNEYSIQWKGDLFPASKEEIQGLEKNWTLSDSVLVRRIEGKLPDPTTTENPSSARGVLVPLSCGKYAAGLQLVNNCLAVHKQLLESPKMTSGLHWSNSDVAFFCCAVLNAVWEGRWASFSVVEDVLSALVQPDMWVTNWHDPDRLYILSRSGFRDANYSEIEGLPSGELYFETSLIRRIESELL